MRISLLEPLIPQNTGNIGRTCLAFNYSLDLIYPLGFEISDKYLKRAGLDYWYQVDLHTHKSFEDYINYIAPSRIIGFSKQGGRKLEEIKFQSTDCLLFGREDKGLSADIKNRCDAIATISMPGEQQGYVKKGVRSLNLSVACGIAAYFSYLSIHEKI